MKARHPLAMEEVRIAIAETLIDIQNYLEGLGAPMEYISLIARDPLNDEMFLFVTNETDQGAEQAFVLARQRIQKGPWKPS